MVGYGYIGKWHAEKIHEHPLADFVAIIESDQRLFKKIQKCYPRVLVTPSLEEALARADAFVVATPTSTHFSIVKMLLEHKKHVLCEKPLTSNHEEALRLASLSQGMESIVQVGHSERFHEVWEQKERYAPLLLPPCIVKADRLGVFKGRATDVDVAYDLMIHDLDIIYHLLGETPILVRAVGYKTRTSRWDHIMADMEFASGTKAVLTSGRDYIEEVRNFEVLNQNGCLRIDLHRHQAKALLNPQKGKNIPDSFRYEKRDHLFIEQDKFYRSILDKTPTVIPFQEGTVMVGIIEKILESLDTRRTVAVGAGATV